MCLSATVLTLPGCGPCTAVKAALASFGVPFEELDVSTDPDAEAMLRQLYERRAGQRPATPVTMLATPEGMETIYGADIRGHLKRWATVAA
ncbi:glutaredoxin family protein [Mycolicibacterium mageritense]|uniref:glutaredoxin family protein n=1 Tax=Mycolicibacterium mageritense TaxID=53462 RepID=UPI0011D61353|nr:glutaredoxin family protein [Mycolicibacterium mageritense]TXI62479.1 MAG: glutaredoxin family protein [Mycolicibacterium mageritense]